ncbi:MAG: glycoside hydrolase family 3 protein [Lachnospiraceae bacterium]|nr:glycoside hydrolase family 3 protein [Lachnospiraceae bacterium]
MSEQGEDFSNDDDEIDSEEELEEDSSLSSGRDTSYEENRRAYRRKRRIRNQIIAYGVVVIIMAVIITAGVMAGRKVSGIIKEKRQNDEQIVQQNEGQDVEADNQQEEILIEEPPEIEEVSVDEQLEEIVNNCISVMPLEDKVAGLFIISPEALTGFRTVSQAGDATQEALGKYAVGGLIYFSQNIEDKEQLSQMISNTAAMSKYPMFFGVDEEGGTVSRVANSAIEVTQVGDMLTIGESGDTTAAYEAGVTIGSYLKDLGFNLDFAPVADVVGNAGNSPLEKRAFGSDPSLCADMVSNVVEGIQGTSVSACLKHFPGIGDSEKDMHEGKAETTKTLDEMKNSDFIPFQAGIESGVDLIMVSHITASSVDAEGTPSSLSRIVITDVLRTDLGFEGVVITDALDMRAISDYYTSEEAAVKAILAGADMLLMPEDFESAYDGVLAAVQDGRISEERIDESLRRIYRIKYADKLE